MAFHDRSISMVLVTLQSGIKSSLLAAVNQFKRVYAKVQDSNRSILFYFFKLGLYLEKEIVTIMFELKRGFLMCHWFVMVIFSDYMNPQC